MRKKQLRTLVLSECGPRERAFLHHLNARNADLILVRVDYSGSPKINHSSQKSVKHAARSPSKQQLFLKRIRHYLSSRILRTHLGVLALPKSSSISWNLLNCDEGAKLLQKLEPDLLLTCGCPMLNKAIFSIPRIAAVNFHFGIAPQYRGNDTVFWALKQKEYEMLGGTVHLIDHGVDTGGILARVYPELDIKDTELTIELKIAEMLADAGSEIIKKAAQEGKISGISQSLGGRNYLSVERSIKSELRAAWHRLSGSICIPLRTHRIERYFNDSS